MRTRRRALVLTDEAARHPFRQSLPPHVRRPIVDEPEPARGWLARLTTRDYRDFFTTYCAAFAAVTVFIS